MNKFILLVLLVFVSCSTLEKKECQDMDWLDKGLQDGSDGESNLDQYQKECSKHGVEVSKEKYETGLTEGLRKFCTYDNGYEFGKNGKSHFNDCPFNSDFKKGHDEALADIEDEKEKKEEDLKKAVSDLNECSMDSDCTDGKRCDSESKYITSVSQWADIKICK
jgi:hypothetical protein